MTISRRHNRSRSSDIFSSISALRGPVLCHRLGVSRLSALSSRRGVYLVTALAEAADLWDVHGVDYSQTANTTLVGFALLHTPAPVLYSQTTKRPRSIITKSSPTHSFTHSLKHLSPPPPHQPPQPPSHAPYPPRHPLPRPRHHRPLHRGPILPRHAEPAVPALDFEDVDRDRGAGQAEELGERRGQVRARCDGVDGGAVLRREDGAGREEGEV